LHRKNSEQLFSIFLDHKVDRKKNIN
jgi:hypothetical protein